MISSPVCPCTAVRSFLPLSHMVGSPKSTLAALAFCYTLWFAHGAAKRSGMERLAMSVLYPFPCAALSAAIPHLLHPPAKNKIITIQRSRHIGWSGDKQPLPLLIGAITICVVFGRHITKNAHDKVQSSHVPTSSTMLFSALHSRPSSCTNQQRGNFQVKREVEAERRCPGGNRA